MRGGRLSIDRIDRIDRIDQIDQIGRTRISLAIALLSATFAIQAQQAPLVTPRDLRPAVPPQQTAPLPQAAPAEAPAEAETLFVRVGDVAVENGYPEFAGATEALLAQVRARRISVADFYRLADAVEALYRNANYPLVRVTVPPQSIKDGDTLRLIVLDGFIERVDVAAVPERSRARVQAVMQGVVGKRRLTGDMLERALTLAGRGPGLTLRSTLGAGTAAGGTVLVLDGELKRVSASVSTDNRLPKSLGPWESTVQVTGNELFGRGEQLYAYVSGNPFLGDARRRVAGGGAIIPLGIDGLSLNPEYTWSDTQTPLQPAVPRSDSRFQRYTLRLSYPLILTRRQELTLTGTLEASTQIDTLPDFQFTTDHDSLRVVRIGAAWSTALATPFASAGRLSLGGTVSQGTNLLGARTQGDAAATGIALSRAGATPAFLKMETNLVYEQPLPQGVQARFSAHAQQALNGVLPRAEIFSLDGEDALSLFPAGSIANDSGWTLRQEFARPLPVALGSTTLMVTPYVFAATGKSYSEIAGTAAPGYNSVAGVGLRSYWRTFNLAMEYGRRNSQLFNLSGYQFFMKAQVQF